MSDFQRKRRRRLERQKHLQDRIQQLAKEDNDERGNDDDSNRRVVSNSISKLSVTRPTTATTTNEDEPGRRPAKSSSSSSSSHTTAQPSASFYRVDRSVVTKEAPQETSSKSSSWVMDDKNLHPRDSEKKEAASTAQKRPPNIRDTTTTTTKPNSSTSVAWNLSDGDDDDDDDLFGGKALLAKFRQHKQKQESERQGTDLGATATTNATDTTTSALMKDSSSKKENGIRITKKGLALEFSDDDSNDYQPCLSQSSSSNHSSSHTRRRRRSRQEDTPTPVSQENSLTSCHHGRDEGGRQPPSSSQDSQDGGLDGNDDDDRTATPASKEKFKEIPKRPTIHDTSCAGVAASDQGKDSDDDDTHPNRHRKRGPRNPIALEKEENASFIRQSSTEQRLLDGDSDGFMSDCDPPLNSEEKPRERPCTRDSKKKRSRSETTGGSSERKKMKARYDSDKEEQGDDSFRELFRDGDLGVNADGDVDVLKPTLSDPKFGPFEPMAPLVLSENNEEKIAVPASLNRYLAPFQKEGVEFMYKCLAKRSGVILGDEMGLGKTVQVIALLCALFDKTGTSLDLEAMRERRKKVSAHRLAVKRLGDEALAQGKVIEEDFTEWTEALGLSSWHPALVVVPPSVMEAWKNSFELFSHFSVATYSSSNSTRAIKEVQYGSADVLLCPKSLFQGESHLKIINDIEWKLVIIDEFHNYKNEKSKISQHLRELKKSHMPLVLGMTGTLMQNNHKELWNLVDLVQTNYFGTKDEFNSFVANPIAMGRQKGAEPSTVERSEKASKALRTKLAKIMIERRKVDVIGDMLPQKSERVIFCSLSKLQKEVYRHVVELPDFDLVKKASTPCDCGVNQNFFRAFRRLTSKAEQLDFYRNNKKRITQQFECCKKIPLNPRRFEEGEPKIDPDAAIWRSLDKHCNDDDAALNGCARCPRCCAFPCMTKLMKLSSHLGLLQAFKSPEVSTKGSPAYVKYMKEREFAKVALAGVVSRLPGGDYDRNATMMDDHYSLSGKLEVTKTLLNKYLSEGSRVLLFAHSTQTLDLIQNFVMSLGTMTYLRMDGQTDQKKRQTLADQFNDDPEIFLFLLSTKATGQGLTLTGANRVILFEQSWNPAWEEQAQDRAHRIGQIRDVDVVRLVAQGTVEEMIYLRQIYKTHLKQDTLTEVADANAAAPRVFRGIQGDKDRKGELFGFENLFRFKDGSFLEDIWAEAGEIGMKDSSGLKMHTSNNLASALIGIGDFERTFEEKDNVSLIQELSQNAKESTRKINGCAFAIEDSDSEVNEIEAEEPLEKKIRAVNHGDLFRNDKGRAAVQEGEEGFDEEMGGATQDAYAVYEERKDQDDDNDDDDDDDRSAASNLDTQRLENLRGQTADGKSPIGKTSSLPLSSQESVHERSGILETKKTSVMEPSMDPEIAIKSDSESRKEPQKLVNIHDIKVAAVAPSRRNETPSRTKIQLAGVLDVDNAKTEFSISDLQLPTYNNKKTRKKKKKS